MARKPSVPNAETVTQSTPAKKAVLPRRHKKATPAIAEALSDPAHSAAVVAAKQRVAITLDPSEVARLAYSYWVARNYQPGSSVEDWFRAENELRQRALANS